jgi:serine/threonine protein kinase
MIERFAGRYELLKRLGQGGMGEVFLARDLATRAECALKRLVPHSGARLSDVQREFELLARLRHPAVVAVHELGIAPDGTSFYTMDYVPGLPADRALARGDWPALYFVAAEVAHALEALHAVGVVHGDLKPGCWARRTEATKALRASRLPKSSAAKRRGRRPISTASAPRSTHWPRAPPPSGGRAVLPRFACNSKARPAPSRSRKWVHLPH